MRVYAIDVRCEAFLHATQHRPLNETHIWHLTGVTRK